MGIRERLFGRPPASASEALALAKLLEIALVTDALKEVPPALIARPEAHPEWHEPRGGPGLGEKEAQAFRAGARALLESDLYTSVRLHSNGNSADLLAGEAAARVRMKARARFASGSQTTSGEREIKVLSFTEGGWLDRLDHLLQSAGAVDAGLRVLHPTANQQDGFYRTATFYGAGLLPTETRALLLEVKLRFLTQASEMNRADQDREPPTS